MLESPTATTHQSPSLKKEPKGTKLSREQRHLWFVITLLCFLLSIIGFDHGEIQPWDEGLYALRARAILDHPEAFWDQTPYAIGGSYSASAPPLSVWAMAAAMHLIGETPFAVRLFSILCHLLSLLLVFALARQIVSFPIAILAPIFLTITTLWNTYARQGMTDVPVITFVLLALFALLRLRNRPLSAATGWGVLFAIANGAALLTKYAISLLPAAFLLYALFDPAFRGKRGLAIAALLFGILPAALWYGTMLANYPDHFSAVLRLPQLTTTVENNSRQWWYYANQLLIANPLFILAAPPIAVIARSWRRRSLLLRLLFLWVVAGSVVLSLSATKMPHYSVFVIPPLLLLSLYGLELLRRSLLSPRWQWILLFGSFLVLWWALVPSLRTALRSGDWHSSTLLFASFAFWIILSATTFPKDVLQQVGSRLHAIAVPVLIILLFFRIASINATSSQHLTSGARLTAKVLTRIPATRIGYVYHHHNPADQWNPQLQWYLQRPPSFWDRFSKFPLHRTDPVQILLAIQHIPDSLFVLYYALTGETQHTRLVLRALSKDRTLLLATRNYFVFGPRKTSKNIQQVRWQTGS